MALGVGRILLKRYLFDLKLLILPSIALKILKPQNGHPPIPRNKMQQVLELMRIERIDIVPKPLDKLIPQFAVAIFGIILEILQIDVLLAVDDHIELVWFKNGQQVRRNYLVHSAPCIFDHFDHTRGAVVFAAALPHMYARLIYSYLFVEFTIVWKPFSLRGMVICVPC